MTMTCSPQSMRPAFHRKLRSLRHTDDDQLSIPSAPRSQQRAWQAGMLLLTEGGDEEEIQGAVDDDGGVPVSTLCLVEQRDEEGKERACS